MALTFFDFLSHAMAQPILFVILILVIGVTAVSGATDAPNAIATVVSTRCLSPNAAIALAAVFNFVGLVGMTYISTAVAKTMFGMVDFSGDTNSALYALVAAMIGAILWGIACWYFGIPCSKSHSLIAGITGGAIAMNGWAGVVPTEWAKVIYGMVFSLVAGFVLGWLFTRLIEWIFKFVQRQAANKIFTIIQDIAAVALSFLHGAQDGQKFMSIAMLGIALSFGRELMRQLQEAGCHPFCIFGGLLNENRNGGLLAEDVSEELRALGINCDNDMEKIVPAILRHFSKESGDAH